ncbi:MAG: hypothetical protein HY582_04715, partial [Candidatus Omnitrophica bacterium]|nr:hypothetical protein [Candidatus Omnitrophota bacterium]
GGQITQPQPHLHRSELRGEEWIEHDRLREAGDHAVVALKDFPVMLGFASSAILAASNLIKIPTIRLIQVRSLLYRIVPYPDRLSRFSILMFSGGDFRPHASVELSGLGDKKPAVIDKFFSLRFFMAPLISISEDEVHTVFQGKRTERAPLDILEITREISPAVHSDELSVFIPKRSELRSQKNTISHALLEEWIRGIPRISDDLNQFEAKTRAFLSVIQKIGKSREELKTNPPHLETSEKDIWDAANENGHPLETYYHQGGRNLSKTPLRRSSELSVMIANTLEAMGEAGREASVQKIVQKTSTSHDGNNHPPNNESITSFKDDEKSSGPGEQLEPETKQSADSDSSDRGARAIARSLFKAGLNPDEVEELIYETSEGDSRVSPELIDLLRNKRGLARDALDVFESAYDDWRAQAEAKAKEAAEQAKKEKETEEAKKASQTAEADSEKTAAPVSSGTAEVRSELRMGLYERAKQALFGNEIKLRGGKNQVRRVFKGTTMKFETINFDDAAYSLRFRWDTEAELNARIANAQSHFGGMINGMLGEIGESDDESYRILSKIRDEVLREIENEKKEAAFFFEGLIEEQIERLSSRWDKKPAERLKIHADNIRKRMNGELSDEGVQKEIELFKSMAAVIASSYRARIHEFEMSGQNDEADALESTLGFFTGINEFGGLSQAIVDLVRSKKMSAKDVLVKYAITEVEKMLPAALKLEAKARELEAGAKRLKLEGQETEAQEKLAEAQTKRQEIEKNFKVDGESAPQLSWWTLQMRIGVDDSIPSKVGGNQQAFVQWREILLMLKRVTACARYGEKFIGTHEQVIQKARSQARLFSSQLKEARKKAAARTVFEELPPQFSMPHFLDQLVTDVKEMIMKQHRYADLAFQLAAARIVDQINRAIEALPAQDSKKQKQAFERLREIFQDFVIRLSVPLAKKIAPQEQFSQASDLIVAANEMSIQDLIDLQAAYPNLRAIVTKIGGSTEHWAIYASGHGVLTLTSPQNEKGNFDHIESGKEAYIDGEDGVFVQNPTEREREDLEEKIILEDAFRELAIEKAKEARGKILPVQVSGSADRKMQVEALEPIADRIGLFRTEFGVRADLNEVSMDKSLKKYEKKLTNQIFDYIKRFPNGVVVRTFDRKGDKEIFGIQVGSREQGFKFYFDPKDVTGNKLLRTQMRAIIRAHLRAKRHHFRGVVEILIPMIETEDDVRDKLRPVWQEVLAEFEKMPKAKRAIPISFMLETKGALNNRAPIMNKEYLDSMSVGTNDLIQELFGINRAKGSDVTMKLYPRIMKATEQIVETAKEKGIKIRICGELAGWRRFALFSIYLAREYGIQIQLVAQPAVVAQLKLLIDFAASNAYEEIKKLFKNYEDYLVRDDEGEELSEEAEKEWRKEEEKNRAAAFDVLVKAKVKELEDRIRGTDDFKKKEAEVRRRRAEAMESTQGRSELRSSRLGLSTVPTTTDFLNRKVGMGATSDPYSTNSALEEIAPTQSSTKPVASKAELRQEGNGEKFDSKRLTEVRNRFVYKNSLTVRDSRTFTLIFEGKEEPEIATVHVFWQHNRVKVRLQSDSITGLRIGWYGKSDKAEIAQKIDGVLRSDKKTFELRLSQGGENSFLLVRRGERNGFQVIGEIKVLGFRGKPEQKDHEKDREYDFLVQAVRGGRVSESGLDLKERVSRVLTMVEHKLRNEPGVHAGLEWISQPSNRKSLLESVVERDARDDFAKFILKEMAGDQERTPLVDFLFDFRKVVTKLIEESYKQPALRLIVEDGLIFYLSLFRRSLRELNRKSELYVQLTAWLNEMHEKYFTYHAARAKTMLDERQNDTVQGLSRIFQALHKAGRHLDGMKNLARSYRFQNEEHDLGDLWSRLESHAWKAAEDEKNARRKKALLEICHIAEREQQNRYDEARKQKGLLPLYLTIKMVTFAVANHKYMGRALSWLYEAINPRTVTKISGSPEIGFLEPRVAMALALLGIGNQGVMMTERFKRARKLYLETRVREPIFRVFEDEVLSKDQTNRNGKVIRKDYVNSSSNPMPGSNLYGASLVAEVLRKLTSDFRKNPDWDSDQRLTEVLNAYQHLLDFNLEKLVQDFDQALKQANVQQNFDQALEQINTQLAREDLEKGEREIYEIEKKALERKREIHKQEKKALELDAPLINHYRGLLAQGNVEEIRKLHPFPEPDPRLAFLLLLWSDALREHAYLNRTIEHLLINDVFGKFRDRNGKITAESVKRIYRRNKWIRGLAGAQQFIFNNIMFEIGWLRAEDRIPGFIPTVQKAIDKEKKAYGRTPVLALTDRDYPLERTGEAGQLLQDQFRGMAAILPWKSFLQPVGETQMIYRGVQQVLHAAEAGERIFKKGPLVRKYSRAKQKWFAHTLEQVIRAIREEVFHKNQTTSKSLLNEHFSEASQKEGAVGQVMKERLQSIVDREVIKIAQAMWRTGLSRKQLRSRDVRMRDKEQLYIDGKRKLFQEMLSRFAQELSTEITPGEPNFEGIPTPIGEKFMQVLHQIYPDIPLMVDFHITYLNRRPGETRAPVRVVGTTKALSLIGHIKKIKLADGREVEVEYHSWVKDLERFQPIHRLRRSLEFDQNVPALFVNFGLDNVNLKPLPPRTFADALVGAWLISNSNVAPRDADPFKFYDRLLDAKLTLEGSPGPFNYMYQMMESYLNEVVKAVFTSHNSGTVTELRTPPSLTPPGAQPKRSELRIEKVSAERTAADASLWEHEIGWRDQDIAQLKAKKPQPTQHKTIILGKDFDSPKLVIKLDRNLEVRSLDHRDVLIPIDSEAGEILHVFYWSLPGRLRRRLELDGYHFQLERLGDSRIKLVSHNVKRADILGKSTAIPAQFKEKDGETVEIIVQLSDLVKVRKNFEGFKTRVPLESRLAPRPAHRAELRQASPSPTFQSHTGQEHQPPITSQARPEKEDAAYKLKPDSFVLFKDLAVEQAPDILAAQIKTLVEKSKPDFLADGSSTPTIVGTFVFQNEQTLQMISFAPLLAQYENGKMGGVGHLMLAFSSGVFGDHDFARADRLELTRPYGRIMLRFNEQGKVSYVEVTPQKIDLAKRRHLAADELH